MNWWSWRWPIIAHHRVSSLTFYDSIINVSSLNSSDLSSEEFNDENTMIGGLFSSRYCYVEFHTWIPSPALTCAHLSSFQGLWLVDLWCLHYITCDVLDQKHEGGLRGYSVFFAECGFMCGFAASADAVFGHFFVRIAVSAKNHLFISKFETVFFSNERLNPLLKPYSKFSNRTLFCPL